MRLPWQKKLEMRSTLGDSVANFVLQQASIKAADAGATAGVECASGALSRAFGSAEVIGPGWVQDAVTPVFLSQVGRDLVRVGSSIHILDMDMTGEMMMIPGGHWTPSGGVRPDTWFFRVQTSGPTSTETRIVPYSGVVLVHWGTSAAAAYRGIGPTSWASLTAKLSAEVERSLGDESAGPVTHFLTSPISPGAEGDDDNDPLAPIKKTISKARGAATVVQSTSNNYDQGGMAPQRDFDPTRLGPDFEQPLVSMQEKAFSAVLAACGCPPGMFEAGADGTAQREALRRWHLNTVMPLAAVTGTRIDDEAGDGSETEIRPVSTGPG